MLPNFALARALFGKAVGDVVGRRRRYRDPKHPLIERDLYLHEQAVDTSTPSGRAMFQMCGVFAEFERGMIRERVNARPCAGRGEGQETGSASGQAVVP